MVALKRACSIHTTDTAPATGCTPGRIVKEQDAAVALTAMQALSLPLANEVQSRKRAGQFYRLACSLSCVINGLQFSLRCEVYGPVARLQHFVQHCNIFLTWGNIVHQSA